MNNRNRERYIEHKAIEDAINKAIKDDQKKINLKETIMLMEIIIAFFQIG